MSDGFGEAEIKNYLITDFSNMAEKGGFKYLPNAGSKYDTDKPPLGLIPDEFLKLTADAFNYGAKKYGTFNFTKGIETMRSLHAALRHISSFIWTEDLDPESKISHLGHAAASLAMCAYMLKNRPDLDDRPKKG